MGSGCLGHFAGRSFLSSVRRSLAAGCVVCRRGLSDLIVEPLEIWKYLHLDGQVVQRGGQVLCLGR
ncbi:hypothetical protein LINPERHAP2_LOCUS10924 [Linum perenne]